MPGIHTTFTVLDLIGIGEGIRRKEKLRRKMERC